MGTTGRRALAIALAAAAIALAAAWGWRAMSPAGPEGSTDEGTGRLAALGDARAESRASDGGGSRRREATPAEASALPLPPFTIRGQVLTARGKPVDGARVAIPVHDNRRKVGHRDARTDRDGRFQIVGLGMWLDQIEVEAPGMPRFLREAEDLWDFRAGDHDFGVVEIQDAVGLKGRVVDESGRPVARARVFVLPSDLHAEFQYRAGHLLEPRTTTDADGRFSLLGFEGEELTLGVDAAGFGARADTFTCVAPRPDVRIVLRSPVVRTVTVVDEWESPLAGASVETEFTIAYGQETARTDARGNATLRFDPDWDSVDVRISKPGYSTAVTGGLRDREILRRVPSARVHWEGHPAQGPGAVAQFLWAAEASAWIVSHQRPVPFEALDGGDYLVSFHMTDPKDPAQIEKRGPFEIPKRLFARTDDFELATGEWPESVPRPPEIPTITLRPIATHPVRGRVVDGRGTPLAGIAVKLEWVPDGSYLSFAFRRSWYTVSAGDGRFEFLEIPAGQVWLGSATPMWIGQRYLERGWDTAPPTIVELPLTRLGRIVGSLTIDGKPPGRAVYLLALLADRIPNEPRADIETPDCYTFLVSASGQLDCGPLEPGEYAFAACETSDAAPVWWDLSRRGGAHYPRAVVEAEKDTAVKLDLALAGGATVFGTVRVNGEPIAEAVVDYQESVETPWAFTTTRMNDMGRYELKLSRGGRYRFGAELDGVRQSREIEIGARVKQQMDFEFHTAAVRGKVEDPLEHPNELQVMAIPAEDSLADALARAEGPRRLDVGADGTFEFRHLGEGNYRFYVCQFNGERRTALTEPVLIQRGEARVLAPIVPVRWISVELRVASRTGGPAHVEVAVGPADLCQLWTPEIGHSADLPASVYVWARLGAEITVRFSKDGKGGWVERRVRVPNEAPESSNSIPIDIEMP